MSHPRNEAYAAAYRAWAEMGEREQRPLCFEDWLCGFVDGFIAGWLDERVPAPRARA